MRHITYGWIIYCNSRTPVLGYTEYSEFHMAALNLNYWAYNSLFVPEINLARWSTGRGLELEPDTMAPHSSTLAWKIPWTEEPGGLQSMGSLRSDTTEWLHFPFSLSCIGEGNGNPLQCSCLENPRDGGAWWAAVYGVTQSRTRLKQLSSSCSSRVGSEIPNHLSSDVYATGI